MLTHGEPSGLNLPQIYSSRAADRGAVRGMLLLGRNRQGAGADSLAASCHPNSDRLIKGGPSCSVKSIMLSGKAYSSQGSASRLHRETSCRLGWMLSERCASVRRWGR